MAPIIRNGYRAKEVVHVPRGGLRIKARLSINPAHLAQF